MSSGQLIVTLSQANVKTKIFDGTIAELPLECIARGVALRPRLSAPISSSASAAGSCIDAAKVIALLLAHGGRAQDYYGEYGAPGPVLPLIALPTTSGHRFGGDTGRRHHRSRPRREGWHLPARHLISHTAICDPELTYSCPPSLTAVSGADALTHAIEAYTTVRREPTGTIVHEHVFLGKNALSDNYALMAISHISASLKPACDNGNDRMARERLMLGATAAGPLSVRRARLRPMPCNTRSEP